MESQSQSGAGSDNTGTSNGETVSGISSGSGSGSVEVLTVSNSDVRRENKFINQKCNYFEFESQTDPHSGLHIPFQYLPSDGLKGNEEHPKLVRICPKKSGQKGVGTEVSLLGSNGVVYNYLIGGKSEADIRNIGIQVNKNGCYFYGSKLFSTHSTGDIIIKMHFILING